MGVMQKLLREGISDGGHIGKIDGGINPDQQHAIHAFCLWVLVHIPTSTDATQLATPTDTIQVVASVIE